MLLFVLYHYITFISLLFITYLLTLWLITTTDWVPNESRISKVTWLNFYMNIYREVIWLMGSSYRVGFLQLKNYSKHLNQIYSDQFWPRLSKNVILNFLHCWMPMLLTNLRQYLSPSLIEEACNLIGLTHLENKKCISINST